MENKEIVWIDWAKTIGILLVVFGHCIQATCFDRPIAALLWNYIYIFHMPLFFIISGYLFKKEQYNYGFFRNLLFSLIIPYLIYSFCFLPLGLYVDVFKNGHGFVESMGRLFLGLIMGDGYETPYPFYLCLPCWFIICILQIRLMFSVIAMNIWTCLSLCIVSVVLLSLLKCFNLDLYFNLDSTLLAIPFFIGGYSLKKWFGEIDRINRAIIFFLFVLSLSTVYIMLDINGPSQMNGPGIGDNVCFYLIGGFAGSFAIILISQFGKSLNVVKIISRNTLFIIFYHWLLLVLYSAIKTKFDLWTLIENDYVALFGSFVFSVLLFIPITLTILYLGPQYPILFGKYLKHNNENSSFNK